MKSFGLAVLILVFLACVLLSGCAQQGQQPGGGNEGTGAGVGSGSGSESGSNQGPGTGGSTGSTGKSAPSTPSISVQNQELGSDFSIVVEKVVSQGPGWIVVYEGSASGSIGEVMGHSAVNDGENKNVKVILKGTSSGRLYAELHSDEGEIGTYEFPGPDSRIEIDGKTISASFDVNLPGGANETKPVPQNKTFTLEAKQWEFIPGTIEVNQGDRVTLLITSSDVMHGFYLPEYGISKQLPAGKEVNVTFVADKQGTFEFRCNVPCGSGHNDMNGRLVVK